jgi:glutathione S-transferase
MKYLSVSEARALAGLRLVLSAHVPGPWGEAAKAIFKVRGVDYQPVEQKILDANEELMAWTGSRNAPIAMLDNDPPVSNWLDLLMLAERIGSGPSLLPDGSVERALSIGISAEICGPHGFGWQRRLVMFQGLYGPGDVSPDAPPHVLHMCRQYGYNGAAAKAATVRIVEILTMLAMRLHAQRKAGADYFVGDQLSAGDLHWASFSGMIAPLPIADAPMPEVLRERYADIGPEIAAALDPILIEHRDTIYRRHIGLPLEF